VLSNYLRHHVCRSVINSARRSGWSCCQGEGKICGSGWSCCQGEETKCKLFASKNMRESNECMGGLWALLVQKMMAHRSLFESCVSAVRGWSLGESGDCLPLSGVLVRSLWPACPKLARLLLVPYLPPSPRTNSTAHTPRRSYRRELKHRACPLPKKNPPDTFFNDHPNFLLQPPPIRRRRRPPQRPRNLRAPLRRRPP